MFEKAVPGNHFNHTHRQFDHLRYDTCPESNQDAAHDLFSNPNAKPYEALFNPSAEELIKIQESYKNGVSYDSDEEQQPNQDDGDNDFV